MAVLFTDEAGNGMAAGVQVSLYPSNVPATAENLLGVDWTQAGGLCPNLAVTADDEYVAYFVGRQAPAAPFTFTATTDNPNTVAVSPYRSPSLTTQGYASLQSQTLWTRGSAWFSDKARSPGGVAWAIAYAYASGLQFLDSATQQRLQAARLQSSAGPDVDSWAYDFLGQWLPRYAGESDLSYKNRIYAALSNPKTTLACLQAIVTAFYTAMSLSSSGALAFDSEVGAFDSGEGAFDLLVGAGGSLPSIYVWDRQSRPDLADLYHINPHNNDGSFVIQLGFALANEQAWYLDYGCVDYESFLLDINQWDGSTTPPDPRLGALVNFVKAAGTKPIYLTTITS